MDEPPFSRSVNVSKNRIYPAANYCIYCKAVDVKLKNEHIFPDGMGGRQILPFASCVTCQRIINEDIEQYCQRQLFGSARARHKIKSQKRKDRPPPSLKVERRDGIIEKFFFDEGNVPVFLRLPLLPVPQIIDPKSPTELTVYPNKWWVYEPTDIASLLQQMDVEAIYGPEINIEKLCRFVAKIAHCTAVTMVHPSSFKTLLEDVIIGKDKESSRYVGGSIDYDAPSPGDKSRVSLFPVERHLDGKLFLAAEVQFFSWLHAPVYLAIVGEMTTDKLRPR